MEQEWRTKCAVEAETLRVLQEANAGAGLSLLEVECQMLELSQWGRVAIPIDLAAAKLERYMMSCEDAESALQKLMLTVQDREVMCLIPVHAKLAGSKSVFDDPTQEMESNEAKQVVITKRLQQARAELKTAQQAYQETMAQQHEKHLMTTFLNHESITVEAKLRHEQGRVQQLESLRIQLEVGPQKVTELHELATNVGAMEQECDAALQELDQAALSRRVGIKSKSFEKILDDLTAAEVTGLQVLGALLPAPAAGEQGDTGKCMLEMDKLKATCCPLPEVVPTRVAHVNRLLADLGNEKCRRQIFKTAPCLMQSEIDPQNVGNVCLRCALWMLSHVKSQQIYHAARSALCRWRRDAGL